MLERVGRLLGARSAPSGRMLGGFVDSLLQMFENCRAGLSDGVLRAGGERVESFFADLYPQERARLRETIRHQEQHLEEGTRGELFERVDERIRKVVIPAYARLAGPFTRRERNDFYLAPEGLHVLERIGWAVVGMVLAAFLVRAPFVPLWEKEAVPLFALAGLVFPNIRRYVALRRYQSELNALVAHTDNEIWRMDLAYLTDDLTGKATGSSPAAADGTLPERLDAMPEPRPAPDRPKPRAREGER